MERIRTHGVAIVFLGALTFWVFQRVFASPTTAVPFGPDSRLYLWNMWWLQQSLFVEHTSPFFTSHLHYPDGVSLLLHSFGFSAMAPWVWLSALRGDAEGVILAHNLAVVSSFFFSAVAVWLLAREESGSSAGALVAAIAYAFSGYRLQVVGWTDLLATHYLVLYVFFLLRALRGSRRAALAAGVFAALSVYARLSFVVWGVFLTLGLVASELRRREQLSSLLAACGTGLVLVLPMILLLGAVLLDGTSFSEPPDDAADRYGLDLAQTLLPHHVPSAWDEVFQWLAPSSMEVLRGSARLFASVREGTFYNAHALSWSLVAIAAWSAVSAARAARRWLAMGVVFLVLALGPHPVFSGEPREGITLPFEALRSLPGLVHLSTPFRFVDPAILCLAVAAAIGVAELQRRIGHWRKAGAALVGAVAVLAVAAEHCLPVVGPFEPRVSETTAFLAREPDERAVLYYPPFREPVLVRLQQDMWAQVTHGKPLLGGFVARMPLGPRYKEPAYAAVFGLKVAERPVAKQVKAIERLCRAEKYGIGWIAVMMWDLPVLARSPFAQAMEQRFPLVHRERHPWWTRGRDRDVRVFRCEPGARARGGEGAETAEPDGSGS